MYLNQIAGYWHKDEDLHCNGICIRRATLRQDGETPLLAPMSLEEDSVSTL